MNPAVARFSDVELRPQQLKERELEGRKGLVVEYADDAENLFSSSLEATTTLGGCCEAADGEVGSCQYFLFKSAIIKERRTLI